MLDQLIYKIGAVALLISLARRNALVPSAAVCVAFIVNELAFIDVASPSWKDLESWASPLRLSNFIIGIFLMSRLKTPEFILGISFIVCSLYHQWMLVEIQNRVLDLKHLRTDFMIILTALQLATVIFILIQGSQNNGGKRAKHSVSIVNRGFHNFLYIKTY